MTIKRKLLGGVVLTVTLLALITAFSVRNFTHVNDVVRETCDFTLPEIEGTNIASQGATNLCIHADDFGEAPDSQEQARLTALVDSDFVQLNDGLRRLQEEASYQMTTLTDPDELREESEHVEQVNKLKAAISRCAESWKAISTSDGANVGVEYQQLHLAAEAVLLQALNLQREAHEEISKLLAETAGRMVNSRDIVALAGTIAALFAVGLGLVVAQPLARRLGDLRHAAERFGSGELTARASFKGRDEIAQLAQGFNDMADKLVATQQQLIQAANAANAANEAKSAFLANMSHEIRTPMTAIVGFAETLMDSDQPASERPEALLTICRNARHLQDLINDVLDISKIEAGKMTVERIECDLLRLIAEIISMTRPRALERGLSLRLLFQGPIPRTICSDPLRLRQILMNLLGNALKFTQHGEIRVRVFAEPVPNQNRHDVCFEVADTGIGMTQEQIARLFQPFTQADQSMTRRFGGSGLGLTISYRLATLLGGTLHVTSNPRLGSTFLLRVDAGSIAADQLIDQVNESMLPNLNAKNDDSHSIRLHGRILLAEDGRDNQRLLTLLLRKAGVDVVIAENGRIAVDLVDTEKFDLILMDMQMPEMDGYTATSTLRARGCTLPIIALTAHAMAEDRAKCLAAGCTEYLTKPVNRAQLIRLLSTFLKHESIAKSSSASKRVAIVAPAAPVKQSDIIRSEFADEVEMQAVIADFVEGLPQQVANMETWLTQRDLSALSRIVHQLKGAGGGYGFQIITETAERANAAIKQNQPFDQIRREVQALLEVIRRIDGFDPSQRAAA